MNLTLDQKLRWGRGVGLGYCSAGRGFRSWVQKHGIRRRSKDKLESTLDSSAAARVNHPHNTSLTSVLEDSWWNVQRKCFYSVQDLWVTRQIDVKRRLRYTL